MTGDYWFKPKTYGFGAQPSSWKGWLATIAFISACLVWSWGMLFGATQSTQDRVVFVAGLIVMIAAFALLARKKTDGAWRWRWGRKGRE